ncbi:MAG TPA: apolipoprotein N-acyltransferase [bacterium]|nr:apolipoprotein N-acyltransferase [bacterium]
MIDSKKPPLLRRGGGFFFAFVSGLLMVSGYPPWNLWGLHLFSLVPLFLALRSADRPRKASALAFACGAAAIGFGYSWMTRFSEWSGSVSYAFWGFLVLYQSAFFALFGAAFASVKRRLGPQAALLTAPFGWVVCEHLASHGPFGVPEWLGHGQLHDPILRPVAAALGVNGLSFAVALVGLSAALLIGDRRPSRAFVAAVSCLAFLVAASRTAAWLGRPQTSETIDVVLLQPRIDPAVLNDGARGQDVLKAYVDETQELLKSGPAPDIVFWSEMVFPYSFNETGPTRRKMAEALADYPGELILGGPEKNGDDFFNSAYLVSGDAIEGVYRKVRLFPFGEYTPLRGFLSFLRRDLPLKLRAQDYSSGGNAAPLNARAGRIGMSICFESVYADFIREEVANGAEVLANLTNDGWFAGSAVDEHHLFVGSMRAVENGRYFLQIASSGLSAVVDADGRTLRRSAPGRSSALRAEVPLLRGETLFTRLGYGRFAVLAVLTLLVWAGAGLGRARS